MYDFPDALAPKTSADVSSPPFTWSHSKTLSASSRSAVTFILRVTRSLNGPKFLIEKSKIMVSPAYPFRTMIVGIINFDLRICKNIPNFQIKFQKTEIDVLIATSNPSAFEHTICFSMLL